MSVLNGFINVEPNVEDANADINVNANGNTLILQVDIPTNIEKATNIAEGGVQRVQLVNKNILV